ncbi:uncharacterized protein LOC115960053 [Quercus lobata]|uniref:uncharacterized protein LOC115960053 n=1 Tax=Quercus lobata TaxID=97700 RepID=UPI00124516CC|nr:uncharacterized protein LOC115960053 [Quercus lobata]
MILDPFVMDRSQSLNTPPFFDESNYALWKVCMRAFLCAIDELVWDFVENGYVKPTTTKFEWDKVALALANANSKAIYAIFCGVSTDEFHKISHVRTAKEAWMILETTYEGTKKVKDTKLQMLTTRFEELKMGDDESFDSFYGKLNEISSKSLALKTITERMDDSSEEDDVEKEVAFLAKNFRKFMKMKNSGKSFSKGKFSSSEGGRKEFKKKDGKEFQSPQGIVCYKCNGHGHLKKECPNYLRGKGKVFATNLSDSDSSNLDTEGECDSEGNYKAFMTIASVDSKNDLSNLVDELGDLSKDEEIEESEDEDVCQNEGEINLQEAYDSLLEDCGKIMHQSCESCCEKDEKANVKVERISTEKLDNVLSSKKSSYDKTDLGYTREGNSSSKPKKEVKFVSAKNIEKLKEVKPEIETLTVVKRTIGAKSTKKREVITQKSKRASSKASVSSLWHTRAYQV